ncbi:cytochrome P450 [Amycolatopsis acidiphila]|nr:cytochrome P450 [Amycolatopsis acidiphila]GHG99503.1 cytochrome P450 [Amycolatopsis acidiphila]
MTGTMIWEHNEKHFWLRGERPERMVSFDESLGYWNVYGYPEALRTMTEPATFSNNTARMTPTPPELLAGNLVQMDAPEHLKLRNLVTHAFTQKTVMDLAPRIRGLATELIDAIEDPTRIELVDDLAYPLPVIVICELLGIPAADRDLFRGWVEAMLEKTKAFTLTKPEEELAQDIQEYMERFQPFRDYLHACAEERRRRPREDLLSGLVAAELDGNRLSDNEIVNFVRFLLLAGHITTSLLLGNTVLALDAFPEQARLVRENPDAISGAIEESLRFLSPFASMGRVTTSEVELGGEKIGKDQLLIVWIAAANRDARQFTDPDTFDLTRSPNPHIAFGRGAHFCLGAPLAKLESRIALSVLYKRFPKLRTDPGRPPVVMESPNMTGVGKLPLIA